MTNLPIQGPLHYYVSIVVPYGGQLKAIRHFPLGPTYNAKRAYGGGHGGTIEVGLHRDVNDKPGPMLARSQYPGLPYRDFGHGSPERYQPRLFDRTISVTRGERIWISTGNIDPHPEVNWISIDDLNNHPVWADWKAGGTKTKGSPIDVTDRRQLAGYDAGLKLLPYRQPIITIEYADGRTWGNGYVDISPRIHDQVTVRARDIGGRCKVRQRFTPDRDLSADRFGLKVYRHSGKAPLTVTLRQGNQTWTATADSWNVGGQNYDSTQDHYGPEWIPSHNAEWGWVRLPGVTLRKGVEVTLELSAARGSLYQISGYDWGSNYMPGGFINAPEAEYTTEGSWTGLDPQYHGHLPFVFWAR